MAGALIVLDRGITPLFGFRILLMGVVALIIGGTRSVWGGLFGGLFVGLSENLALCVMGPEWQETIVFGLLLTYLLLRSRSMAIRKIQGVRL